MPLKSVNPMARNAPAVVNAPVKIPCPVNTIAFVMRLGLALAVVQFLLVARDQMDAEINRQPDQDGHKRDRQDVQMPDHQRW